MTIGKRIQNRRKELGLSADELADFLGKDRSTIYRYESNDIEKLPTSILEPLAKALKTTPAYLMGWENNAYKYPPPNITDDYTTFPVLADIAAGYDHMAIEAWKGDIIDIPNKYLKGRDKSDFFVLCVKGDSMYPAYQEGDKVLILKQSVLDYSGQIGAIMYNSDYATLKKIEFKQGANWIKLVPINPSYPTVNISGEDLRYCRIMGIPRLIIREVDD